MQYRLRMMALNLIVNINLNTIDIVKNDLLRSGMFECIMNFMHSCRQ